MDRIARQSIATMKLRNTLPQDLLGPPQPFRLVNPLGETFEELLDHGRDRGAALGGDNPGMTIGGIVE